MAIELKWFVSLVLAATVNTRCDSESDNPNANPTDTDENTDVGTDTDTDTDADADTDADMDTDTDTDGDTDVGADTDFDGSICMSDGDRFAFGVSSYGDLRQWAVDANEKSGAGFKYLYVYILDGGMSSPDDFRDWYIVPFVETADSVGAIPFFTFYQLLDIGRRHEFQGTEPEIVKACLENASCMSDYFSNFVWFMKILDEVAPEAVVQVEPDSWGFMMWAMGIEGNDDPFSVEAMVSGSGFEDVGGFEDNAAGLGRALVALRDRFAPDVRMGWHASNFRVGTRPEVVTAFFSQMGKWDLLVSENMHNEADPTKWWLPWDDALTETNLTWIATVTEAAHLPMILWQLPIGSTDYHLIGNPEEEEMLARHAEAGVIAALFEHLNNSGAENPDDYRAAGDLGSVPPSTSGAGGTAADMRDRVASYQLNPLVFPDGSICR